MADEGPKITDAEFEVVKGPDLDHPHFDPAAHTTLMWKLAAEQVAREEAARKNTPLRRGARRVHETIVIAALAAILLWWAGYYLVLYVRLFTSSS